MGFVLNEVDIGMEPELPVSVLKINFQDKEKEGQSTCFPTEMGEVIKKSTVQHRLKVSAWNFLAFVEDNL